MSDGEQILNPGPWKTCTWVNRQRRKAGRKQRACLLGPGSGSSPPAVQAADTVDSLSLGFLTVKQEDCVFFRFCLRVP